ncbi:MAG: site-2 protease family protein [Chloroflexota bacterium]|nr:site-2 protease family protein [Chloroflexota bacterium]
MLGNLFDPNRLFTLGILFLTSMPFHEWAHAWAALQLGDDTAARRGRLTLSPLAHLDPIGAFSLVLFGFGWGKPVPVSPYRLRGDMRRSYALVSIAGPLSNLMLAMLAAIPFRLGWLGFYGGSSIISLQDILMRFITINLALMLFNLIPFPPLDGSRVLAWLLPRRWAVKFEQLEQYCGPGLMLVLYLLSRLGIIGAVMNPLMSFMFRALLVY